MANNTDNKNEKTGLEERFSMIEDILGQMEDENVTLDQSFDLYKQGIEQIKAANADLDRIEKAMLVMNEDGELEEF
jgi:exodeoxyribonuclease VII small subunit|uniref:exodeoxyribonuclease VII small subunit n=1 Tax=Agathobacter sp. TaxID=2021311 RepID=UPI004024CAFA